MKCYIKRQVNTADQAPLVLHFAIFFFHPILPNRLGLGLGLGLGFIFNCTALYDFSSPIRFSFKIFWIFQNIPLYTSLSISHSLLQSFILSLSVYVLTVCLSVCLCVCLSVYLSLVVSYCLSLSLFSVPFSLSLAPFLSLLYRLLCLQIFI